jgi:hypothetical protein
MKHFAEKNTVILHGFLRRLYLMLDFELAWAGKSENLLGRFETIAMLDAVF